jgi:hypothetical protein
MRAASKILYAPLSIVIKHLIEIRPVGFYPLSWLLMAFVEVATNRLTPCMMNISPTDKMTIPSFLKIMADDIIRIPIDAWEFYGLPSLTTD